jgi:hypothetical protein
MTGIAAGRRYDRALAIALLIGLIAVSVIGVLSVMRTLGLVPTLWLDLGSGADTARQEFSSAEISTSEISLRDGSPASAVADALTQDPGTFGLSEFARATISDERVIGESRCYVVRVQPAFARYVVRVTPINGGSALVGIAESGGEGWAVLPSAPLIGDCPTE